ncbi:efflux RND transporter periplasmic adaptor subunit [Agaribacterium sp. ZY112]|uniref:efflux RND transporter periplasmic adaptor subunit n=1 Tax=Agaribacterium sp. ZY112 TaxID=3233574 RepID=UPI003524385A
MLRLTSLLFCSAFVLIVSACGKKEPEPIKDIIKPVKFYTVDSADTVRFEYPGQVSAAQESTMAFEVPGRIVNFPVVEGQEVRKGDVLAQLDLRDYESNLAAARSEYDRAKSNFNRGEELIKGQFISQMDYDNLRTSESAAKANLERSEKALEDATLRAPFDGMVAKKIADDFANVRAKQDVLLLHNLSDLEVVINIPESDWARVERSRQGEARNELDPHVQIAGFPKKIVPAVVREVSTTANPTTRTYAIKLAFKSEGDEMILPGMTAKAYVDLPNLVQGVAMQVPVNGVAYDSDGKAYVWLIDSSHVVSQQFVEVGQLVKGNIEILSGLKNGDVIATSGVHHLKAGAQVREFK